LAQFDVYPNPSKAQRPDIPWMVDVQSDLLSGLPTRLVMPLALRKHMPGALPRALCPAVQWKGDAMVALPHLAAAFRVKDLGIASGSLRAHASALVGALDAVISGV
jgi:toxin CcdB